MEDMTTSTSLVFDLSSIQGESTESPSKINLDIKLRNVVIGCLGALANIAAFCVVLKSKTVTSARKLLLLNLILTDIAMLLSLVLFGVEKSFRISREIGCMLLVLNVNMSIYISYIICVILSFVNFLAVYKPFSFTRIVSFRNIFIVVVVSWLTAAGCNYLWIDRHPPSGLTCSAIVILSDIGLIGYSTVLLGAAIGVFGLNAAVVFKLNEKSLLLTSGHTNGSVLSQQQRHTATKTSSRLTSLLSRVFRAKLNNYTKDGVHSSDTLAETRTESLRTTSDNIMNGDNRLEGSSTKNAQLGLKSFEMSSDAVKGCPLSLATVCSVTSSMVEDQPSSSKDPAHQNDITLINELDASADNAKDNTDLDSSQKMDKVRSSDNQKTILSVSKSSKTPCSFRICKKLMILTTLSLVITLPVVLYLVAIVAKITEPREKLLSKNVWVFISSCPFIKACFNPVFYVLNFMNWRKKCGLSACCCRGH